MIDIKNYDVKIIPITDYYSINKEFRTENFDALAACSGALLFQERVDAIDLKEEINLLYSYLYRKDKIGYCGDWDMKYFLADSENEYAVKFRKMLDHKDFKITTRTYMNPQLSVYYTENDYETQINKKLYESDDFIALITSKELNDAFMEYHNRPRYDAVCDDDNTKASDSARL